MNHNACRSFLFTTFCTDPPVSRVVHIHREPSFGGEKDLQQVTGGIGYNPPTHSLCLSPRYYVPDHGAILKTKLLLRIDRGRPPLFGRNYQTWYSEDRQERRKRPGVHSHQHAEDRIQ